MKVFEAPLWLTLCALCLAQPALAQATKEAINISADRATYEAGTGSYEGNVVLTQGELAIHADKLVINEEERKVEHILALGNPARLIQGDGSISAEARSIEYYVQTGKVILLENAHIAQQGSEISGNRITYDSKRRRVLAEGDSGKRSERVNMTLQPSTADDDKDKSQ